MKLIFPFAMFALASAYPAMSDSLSPAKWNAVERTRVESLEQAPMPPASRVIDGKSGIVSATMSPIAVRTGIEVLKQGGTAADAAAAVALTQVTTALGSYVSYAGIMELVYFEAKTAKVYTLNAGWGTYQGETDPKGIPTAGNLDPGQGRKTLVPGFMAGIEAMHHRFGRLPFADLFEPAIWYSENGITLSPFLAGFLSSRQAYLSRTPEGKAFLHQGGDHPPVAGERFVQTEAAKTLRAVAQHGAQSMYTGAWGQEYVAAVQREGGKATLEDMKRYRPVWEEPLNTEFAGRSVYGPGRGTEGGFQVLEVLNLIEELKIDRMKPYWQEPVVFGDLSRALEMAAIGPYIHSFVAGSALKNGIHLSLEDRASKNYAKAVLPLLENFFNPAQKNGGGGHSDAIVVIDQWGNIAALVHSINTVLWGSTGIVVGGVPVSDAASFQQARLAALAPGALIPNEMAPVIAMRNGKPELAVAAVGAALIPETVRILLGTLGNHLDAKTVMAAPPLLLNSDYTKRGMVQIPEGRYGQDFLASLGTAGLTVQTKTSRDVFAIKGTAVMAMISTPGSLRQSVEDTGIFGFADGY